MKTNTEIDIRDTYILPWNGQYYMYGTCGRDAFTGTKAGFLCYRGTDLESWEGPFCVFPNNGSCWANSNFWAPEVYHIKDAFYMFASWTSTPTEMGIRSPQTLCILRADNPLGPFEIWNDNLCIGNDPTLYEKDGHYFLIYNDTDVTMLARELKPDLRDFCGEAIRLFSRLDPEVTWSVGGPTEGAETYVTPKGNLLLLWSSFCKGHSKKFAAIGLKDMDYGTAIARSDSGSLAGPYVHGNTMLTPPNMGHCNLFYDLSGNLMLSTHYPDDNENAFGCSNPIFFPVRYDDTADTLYIPQDAFDKLKLYQ